MKTSNRATVNELSPDQMQELAQSYLCDHYADYNPEAAAANEGPSWGELAAALEIVGRETLANEYVGVVFSPDDFLTSASPRRERYEIRQIDAIAYDDGWTYNETWPLGAFETTAQDIPRAFRRALARLSIRFYRGRTRTEYDGSVYEIIDRKTGAPLFVAIPTD